MHVYDLTIALFPVKLKIKGDVKMLKEERQRGNFRFIEHRAKSFS